MKYILKDITTINRGIIAHGVNCQGAMGSGVALALKRKWPEIYISYVNNPTGVGMLGKSIKTLVDPAPIIVVNCYTQEYYGPGDKRYASPDAILHALSFVYNWASCENVPVYLPKIGAGLGGLDWHTDVKPIIEELESIWSSVDTYICVIDEKELEN